MLAREKYREASYFYTEMSRLSGDPEAFKHNLSAFLSAFRSVTFYLQKEFANDPLFEPWYVEKQKQMRDDPVFFLLNKQRVLTVHKCAPRVVGKFTVYVAEPAMAMAEAVQVLLKAPPGGSTVTYIEPPNLPREFVESGNRARVERQLFFDGYEERDLFAVSLEGLFALDRMINEWEKIISS